MPTLAVDNLIRGEDILAGRKQTVQTAGSVNPIELCVYERATLVSVNVR
jgi:hypothetical protein